MLNQQCRFIACIAGCLSYGRPVVAIKYGDQIQQTWLRFCVLSCGRKKTFWSLLKTDLDRFSESGYSPRLTSTNHVSPRDQEGPLATRQIHRSTRQNRPRGVCIWSIVLADDVSADLEAASAGMEASVPLRNIRLSFSCCPMRMDEMPAGALADVQRTNRSRKRLVSIAPLGLCLSGSFFYALRASSPEPFQACSAGQ